MRVNGAFTLVELLGVIVIVSLAMSVVSVRLGAGSDHARLGEAAARWRDLDARARLLARGEGPVLMLIDERAGSITLRRAGSGEHLAGFLLPRGVVARVEAREPITFDRLGRSPDYVAVLTSEAGERRWRVFGLTGWTTEEAP